MKNFIRRLPVKIICFILCVLLLCTTVAGVAGAIVISLEDFYTKTIPELVWDAAGGDAYDDACIITYSAVSGKDYNVNETYAPENTNLRYALFDGSNKLVKTNCGGNDEWEYYFSFRVYQEGDHLNANFINAGSTRQIGDDIWVLAVYIDEELTVADEYALCSVFVLVGYSLRYWIFAIVFGALALFLTLFIVLLCASGRRPDSDCIHPGCLNAVPFDIILACVCALAVPFLILLDETDRNALAYAISIAVSAFAAVIAVLGLSMSIAARVKQHELFKNTVIWRVCVLIWKLLRYIGRGIATVFRALPMIWRAAVVIAVNALLDFIIALLVSNRSSDGLGAFLLFIKMAVMIGLGLYAAIFMCKLQKGAQALADGDLAYTIDTKGMYWDFKKHGENLNSISSGMSVAVEKRLQSERMKAELVTNVSHDIKTPLTSVINYANLISEENCDCAKHSEYSEVLLRKSEHLKRLLDDLVEISKAQTGNLDVSLAPCDACVLLTQASGEYMQKCENAGLELVSDIPEESIGIMADSRRIWRVFENLLNNAVKYSLPGSRVYITLEREGQLARFTFRNTSKNMLKVTPEELTERFVRGDSSRTTEGNGLGLSIAKSLTELQNGRFELFIDGDLFKVTLAFPAV